MRRALRLALLALLGAALLAPVWLLATDAGLRAVLRIAQRVTDGRLSVAQASGSLTGGFTLQDTAFAGKAVTVRIDHVAAQLWWQALFIGRVHLDALEIQAIAIELQPRPAPATPPAPLTVRAPIAIAVEDAVVHDLRIRAGDGGWTLPEARFAAVWSGTTIDVERLTAGIAETGALQAQGRIDVTDGAVRFTSLHVQHDGIVSLRGVVDGALGLSVDHDLTLQYENLRVAAAPVTSARGSARLRGRWAAWTATLAGAAEGYGVGGDLQAELRGDLSALEIVAASLRTLGGVVEATGRLAWAGGVQLQANLRLQDLDPGARFPGWNGRVAGTGTVAGDWRAAPRLEFSAALRDSQLRGYPLSLDLAGRGRDGAITLQRAELQTGASTLRASGRLWPTFALDGALASTDLRSPCPVGAASAATVAAKAAPTTCELAGAAQVTASLRGSVDAPVLALQADGQQIRWRGQQAARVRVEGRLAPAGRSELRASLHDVPTRGSPAEITLSASGTRADHAAELRVQRRQGTGTFALRGGEAPTAEGWGWRGRLTEATVALENRPDWQLEEPAALRWQQEELRSEPICLVSTGSRACAQLTASTQRQRLAFRTRAFALAHLAPLLPPDWRVESTLTGTAVVQLASGELAEVRADLAASAGSLTADGQRVEFGPGTFVMGPEGDGVLATVVLRPAQGEISGDVLLGPAADLLQRPMSGRLLVKLPDLAWLPVLSREIAEAHGALDAALHVSGTLRQPSLDGEVTVAGGRVILTSPGIELTDLTASFVSTPQVPLKVTVKASAGGGTLALDGQLDALRPHLAGAFRLTGENAQVMNTLPARIWVTPALDLALAEGGMKLTGEIAVPRAEITPKELGEGGIKPSGDTVIVQPDAGEPGRDPLRFESDVRITLGDNVRFDGLGLKTQLTGALQAYDQLGQPTRARGELQLVGGRYKAYGQDLQIETGRLIFAGGPVTDPAIDLSAFRQPRDDIKVGLRARGTLDSPSFSLYSVPAMPQEEQLSWLVLGRSLSETLATGQADQLASPALSLGLSGGNYLAERYGQRLGLDEVSVGAKPGETAEKARFTIGKYLSPKLFISYGVGLFQPGNFFRLQYDLGRGFKLSGESGVAQGGDLLYTIER